MPQIEPIGYFHSSHLEKYSVPRQPNLADNEGVIVLNQQQQFEQALEGLEEFDKIWVLYHFHQNNKWKPKVLPPRGLKKRGVFATRSPHRPNFIGMSCVDLKEIKGLKLYITKHDLLDGTPILDIKPYINYIDAAPASRQGWLESVADEKKFIIFWSKLADEQAEYLKIRWDIDVKTIVEARLSINPLPYPNNRIKEKEAGLFEIAFKSWRILYKIQAGEVRVLSIKSGYNQKTLEGLIPSRWTDVPIHQAFQAMFPAIR